jgi:guanylate kinase
MSSNRSINIRPSGTLVIVSGPSGAGKTTLVKGVCRYFESLDNPLYFSVSHTTRDRREGETEGVDYHFVSKDRFLHMANHGEFIVWAHVHGHMYGTSVEEVRSRLKKGQDVILDIDVQGARQISSNKDLQAHAVSAFVFTSSFEELETRLRNRGLNTEEQIQMRLAEARREIEHGINFYDYVIINDVVETATDCLKAAVIAKKLKSSGAKNTIRELAHQFSEGENGQTT